MREVSLDEEKSVDDIAVSVCVKTTYRWGKGRPLATMQKNTDLLV
jgi:hypothetical protein